MYLSLVLFFVILRRPPRTKRTNTLFPCTTLVRSLQTEFAELRRLADERATRLHSANDIVALASRQVRPWIRQLAALASRKEQRHLRRLREALTRWNKVIALAIQDTPTTPNSEATAMDIFDFDRRDPYHRAASLEDLCRLSDSNYIRCAFVTILGRARKSTRLNSSH